MYARAFSGRPGASFGTLPADIMFECETCGKPFDEYSTARMYCLFHSKIPARMYSWFYSNIFGYLEHLLLCYLNVRPARQLTDSYSAAYM